MFFREIYLQKTKDIFLTHAGNLHKYTCLHALCVYVDLKRIFSELKQSLSDKETSRRKSIQIY